MFYVLIRVLVQVLNDYYWAQGNSPHLYYAILLLHCSLHRLSFISKPYPQIRKGLVTFPQFLTNLLA